MSDTGGVRARFAAPVLPGQTLRTRMWCTSAPGAPARIVFETVVFETGARKRMRFERALGASVSLEDVSNSLNSCSSKPSSRVFR